MIQVWLINEQGYFTGESKFVNEEELTPQTITKPILTGYVKTKWSGVDWEEGATAEEIQEWKDANKPKEKEPNEIDNLTAQVEALNDVVLMLFMM